MQINEIRPGIFHIVAPTQYILTMSFMRLQEFYESPYPEIRGRLFSIEQYMDLYAERTGNFTYLTDWSGFNIPGNVVTEFYNMYAHLTSDLALNHKERLLMKLLWPMTRSKKKFYVIGTYQKGKRRMSEASTVRHEIAHGYFYLNETYRNEMSALVSQFKFKQKFGKDILKLGYNKSVLVDEIQAYLSTSSMEYLKKRFPSSRLNGFEVPKEFGRTFMNYQDDSK